MKKIILSLVALLFSTFLFAQVQVVSFNNDGKRTIFKQQIAGYQGMGDFWRIKYLSNGKIAVLTRPQIYYEFYNTPVFRHDNQKVIMLYNQDGSLDNSFVPYSTGNSEVVRIEEVKVEETINKPSANPRSRLSTTQTNLKLLFATNYEIKRLNINGSIDSAFNPVFRGNTQHRYYPINDFVVQKDGKIVVCGAFTSVNGENIKSIVRLYPDGSLDNSFQRLDAIFSEGYKLHLQPDDKILFVAKYATDGQNRLVRLNPNGIVDFQFFNANTDVRFNQVNFYPQSCDIDLQSNGKIVVSNYHQFIEFKLGRPTLIGGLIRFNTNGTLDNTFSHKIIESGIKGIEIDKKDRIYVIGWTSNTYNTSLENLTAVKKMIVRIEPNGANILPFITSNDYNFNKCVGLQLNPEKNKIMVIGSFGGHTPPNEREQAPHYEFHISDLGSVQIKDPRINDLRNILNRPR
jgi:uncharacterized delta-60 repeat protein